MLLLLLFCISTYYFEANLVMVFFGPGFELLFDVPAPAIIQSGESVTKQTDQRCSRKIKRFEQDKVSALIFSLPVLLPVLRVLWFHTSCHPF